MMIMGNILGPYLSWYIKKKPKCKMSTVWSRRMYYFSWCM